MKPSAQSDVLVMLLAKDLSLSEDESAGLQTSDQDRLLSQLERLIAYLLDHDFNRLINACYRMDIPEHDLNTALNTDNPQMVAHEVARLIIARQWKKVEMRAKYQ